MNDTDARRIEDKVDGLAVILARLEGSLSPTLDKLTDGQASLDERQKAFEAETEKRFEKIENEADVRFSALERFRYSVPSLSVLALVLTAIEALYYLTHLH